MPQPLSPRAQEILAEIEREVVGRREAGFAADELAPAAGPAGPDAAQLLELVDALGAQAEQARRRLGTLTDALRASEAELDADGEAMDPEGGAPESVAGPPADAAPPRLQVTDLHHHLLPGVDDGPATLEEALALARAAVAAGTTTVVATPHVAAQYPATTAATIAAGVSALSQALTTAGIPLRVLPGAEIAVAYAVALDDDELMALRLGGGDHLLVECPFAPAEIGLEHLLESLLVRGHRILLAHPERCPLFLREPGRLAPIVARGVLVQITASSLTGSFGGAVRETAHAFLRDGLVHVVASDAHSADRRPPSVVPELEQEGYGDRAAWLVDQVPRAILAGDPIPPAPA